MSISSIIIVMLVVKSMKAARNYHCNKIARNISIMLVSLNFMFILLTAPIVILLAVDANYYQTLSYSLYDVNESDISKSNESILFLTKTRLFKIVCIIIMNSNHACNIMIYCLIGREFRRHFVCAVRKLLFGDSKYRSVYVYNQHHGGGGTAGTHGGGHHLNTSSNNSNYSLKFKPKRRGMAGSQNKSAILNSKNNLDLEIDENASVDEEIVEYRRRSAKRKLTRARLSMV